MIVGFNFGCVPALDILNDDDDVGNEYFNNFHSGTVVLHQAAEVFPGRSSSSSSRGASYSLSALTF